MDVTAQAECFRAQIRRWIADHAPPGLAALADWNALYLGSAARAQEEAEANPLYREWEQQLLQAGLVCPQWPAAVGGRGVSPAELAIFNEELHRAAVPRVRRAWASHSSVRP